MCWRLRSYILEETKFRTYCRFWRLQSVIDQLGLVVLLKFREFVRQSILSEIVLDDIVNGVLANICLLSVSVIVRHI